MKGEYWTYDEFLNSSKICEIFFNSMSKSYFVSIDNFLIKADSLDELVEKIKGVSNGIK